MGSREIVDKYVAWLNASDPENPCLLENDHFGFRITKYYKHNTCFVHSGYGSTYVKAIDDLLMSCMKNSGPLLKSSTPEEFLMKLEVLTT